MICFSLWVFIGTSSISLSVAILGYCRQHWKSQNLRKTAKHYKPRFSVEIGHTNHPYYRTAFAEEDSPQTHGLSKSRVPDYTKKRVGGAMCPSWQNDGVRQWEG